MKVKGARKLRDILMSMSERKKAILITVLLLIVSVVNFVVDIYEGLSRADIVLFACNIFHKFHQNLDNINSQKHRE